MTKIKRRFYIDRQFGTQIWIETEGGIVINATGETKRYNEKLLEHYKGKSISFLKEDFEKRMKPSYHCVKPDLFRNLLARRDSIINKGDNILRIHRVNKTENSEECKKALDSCRKELDECLKELEKEKIILASICYTIKSRKDEQPSIPNQ